MSRDRPEYGFIALLSWLRWPGNGIGRFRSNLNEDEDDVSKLQTASASLFVARLKWSNAHRTANISRMTKK
jgi:hypothetical protein